MKTAASQGFIQEFEIGRVLEIVGGVASRASKNIFFTPPRGVFFASEHPPWGVLFYSLTSFKALENF